MIKPMQINKITNKELGRILLSAFVISLISSYRLWGHEKFDFYMGLKNLGKHIIINLFILFYIYFCYYIFAKKEGYNIEYFTSKLGLLITFLLSAFSNGYIKIYMPGWIKISSSSMRIGHKQYRESLEDYNKGLRYMILGMLILIYLAKIYGSKTLMIQSILILVYSLIPIPNNFGFIAFYSDIEKYSLNLILTMLSLLLLFFTNIIIAITISAIIAYILKDKLSNTINKLLK